MLGVRLGGACLFGRRPGVGFEEPRGGHFNLAVLPDHPHFFDSAFTVLHLLCLLASWSGAVVAALIPCFLFLTAIFGQNKLRPLLQTHCAEQHHTFFSTPCCRVPSNFVQCNDPRRPRPNATTTSTTVNWLLSITGVMSMKVKNVTLLFKMCVYN